MNVQEILQQHSELTLSRASELLDEVEAMTRKGFGIHTSVEDIDVWDYIDINRFIRMQKKRWGSIEDNARRIRGQKIA